MREGLADVITIHELLTNQILLFNFEIVATPWLQYCYSFRAADCELITSAGPSLTFLEGDRGSGFIGYSFMG